MTVDISQMLDRGEQLSARIAGLQKSYARWEPVRVAVEVVVNSA